MPSNKKYQDSAWHGDNRAGKYARYGVCSGALPKVDYEEAMLALVHQHPDWSRARCYQRAMVEVVKRSRISDGG